MALLLASALTTSAQEKKAEPWYKTIKVSGYVMTQYQYDGKEGNEANSFNLRMARLALDGRIANDFYWKAQLQVNGNTSTLGSSPRLVDAFAEWQKYDFFMVKAGQFKRPFTFENPMHPIDQGFMGYSQNVTRLAGFNDRCGEQASNGRDIGVQIQGDLLKNAKGRALVHYQLGVFNGQGINTKDEDQRKDIIGGAWGMPVSGLRIGAFGWTGSFAHKYTETLEDNSKVTRVASVDRIRYALSAEYKANDWTVRSEYIHSTGGQFTGVGSSAIDDKAGSKADGVYALAIAPVLKNKLYAKARYDLYRPTAEWNKARTQYEVGVNYKFNKFIQLNTEYARVNDRSLAKGKHNYNMADVELDFRF